MGKKLTPQLIQMRCKTDKLTSIEKINLWGNDLEDVSILRDMPNVEVVSLSLNKIYTLEDFAYCGKLNELYLRKNDISDLKEIHYLAHLPNLEVLWLWDNPICGHKYYRPFILKILPNLKKLDNEEITMEERQAAANMHFDEEDLSSENMMQHIEREPEPMYNEPEPVYESPAKPVYEPPERMKPVGGGLQRTPPKKVMMDDYAAMPEPMPKPSQMKPTMAGMHEPWSKGGAGDIYAGNVIFRNRDKLLFVLFLKYLKVYR